MNDTADSKNDKRPYEKPLLRIIELAAEEVLVVGCKTNQASPPGYGNLKPCIVRPCYGPGS